MQRAVITPDAIRNPGVGFKGYTLSLQAGYTAVAATNIPATLDPSIKELALKWKRTFAPGARTNHWIRFEESMVIHGSSNAVVFGVIATRNPAAFNLACATD